MIKILLFAGLQEAAGVEQLVLDRVPPTVHALKKQLIAEYPVLRLDQVMVAVNEEIVANEAETALQTGDIVALLPPVSGG